MTVLHLISSEGYYGAESMLVALARALSGMGWEAIVGVLADRRFPHTEVAQEALRQGLRAEVVPCAGRWDWRAVRRVGELIGENGVEVIHAHGYKADFYARAAGRPRRAALVATCHNWPNKLLRMQAYAALDRLVLRSFDQVATASPAVACTLKRWGVRATLVPNGVDIARFRGAEPTLRRELGRDAGPVVGFVGRMVEAKGGAALLEAASGVLHSFPDATFVLVGEGPARGEWEALSARLGIASSVVFAGVRRDMPGVYASFDVLALPSYEENMPMCLLEAMAAGTAVIATRVGAVPQMILPDRTGVLIEPGDVASLAAGILRLLRDPGEARRLGANAHAHAMRSFSSVGSARRYAALYERAAGGFGGRRRAGARAGPAEDRRVKVSVVVACRNEMADIRAFVDSLLAQDTGGLEWEAILADGMSDDGTREFLERYCAGQPRVRVIPNPGGIVSTGLNAAIRAARGEIILRMDMHSVYAPDYVRQCVDTLVRTGADNAGGPARTRAQGLLGRAIAAAYHSRFSTGGARFHDERYEGWTDTVPFGCWRKETLERLGLFDVSLVRNQDDELNLRLARAGGRIWQNPAIRCWYSPRANLRALFRQYMQYGFWKVAVIRKHRLPGSWRHLVPVAFVAGNAALAAGMAIAAACGARVWLEDVAAIWVALAGVYIAAVLAASLAAARRRGWALLPYLPAAFATFHVSYGLGFAAGLLRFAWKPGQALVAESAFTRITR